MGIGLGRFHGIAARLGLRPAVANAVALPGAAGMERGASGTALNRLAGVLLGNLAAEEERWLAWCVVAFGGGIAIYFSLKAEPSLALAAGVGLAGLLCSLRAPRRAGTAMRFLCMLVAAGALGFAAAKLRTFLIDAPAITRDLGPVPLIGRIETVDIKAPNRARIVLALSQLGDGKSASPRYVRLTLIGTKAVTAAQPGAVVSALAVLRPPPEPSMPHGYDFARWAYFHGIGAVGFTYGAPKPLEAAPPASPLNRLLAGIENLRLSMTGRIAKAVPGPDGSIASALITGERGRSAQKTLRPTAIRALRMCSRFRVCIWRWRDSAYFGLCGPFSHCGRALH